MRRLVIVGSDSRDQQVAKIAEREGWTVQFASAVVTQGPGDLASSFPEGASLLGPVMGIDDDGRIQTEHGVLRLDDEVLEKMIGGVCAAGIVAPSVRRRAEGLGIRVVSYRESEAFSWQNAVLTAEGAIQATIGASGYGVYRRPIGILGYGRVGQALARRLSLLGAKVRVFDEELSHRAQAESEGISAYPIAPEAVGRIDLLFNTIPHPVITQEWERPLQDVLIFELASAPGGMAAEVDRAKLALAVLSGLPGKIAPMRAAEIIWETVMAVDPSVDTRGGKDDGSFDRSENWPGDGSLALQHGACCVYNKGTGGERC